jgi:hypothetical protein
MSDKGYQIIEPSIIGEWLGTVKHEGILFCLLNWLVYLLLSNDDGKFSNVELEVLCVEYDGKYPAIGVHYKNPSDEDLEEYITSRVEMYLREKPVFEFVTYAFGRSESWVDLYKKFVS